MRPMSPAGSPTAPEDTDDGTASGRYPAGDALERDAVPAPAGASWHLLRSLLRPNVRRLTLAIALLLGQQTAELAGPLLVAYAIDHAVPLLRAGDASPIAWVAVSYLLCAMAAGAFRRTFIRQSAVIGQDILVELRTRLFSHALAMSIAFHESFTAGRIISRTSTDIEALRELLEGAMEQIVSAGVSLAYISVILLVLDWRIGIAALAAMGPIYLTMRSFRRRSIRVYRRRSSTIAVVITKFSETLGAIRTVQAFRQEQPNDQHFAALNERHERSNGDSGLEMARYVASSRLVANIAIALIVLWSAYRAAAGELQLGVLAAAVLYLRPLYNDPLQLGGVLDAYQSASASLEKIVALLAQQPAIAEPADPRPAAVAGRRYSRPGSYLRWRELRVPGQQSGPALH